MRSPLKKRIMRSSVVVLAILAVVLGMVLPSLGSTLPGSTFEIDGDLTHTGTNLDWDNAPALQTAGDLTRSQQDNSFGQGTKEDSAVPTVVNGSIPNNKSDLSHFYLSHETVGSTSFLYLGWTRVNTLGTANMDFEFNQNDCNNPPDAQTNCSSNGTTPVRSTANGGDILITFDFAQGGKTVNLGLSRWISSGTCQSSNSYPCWSTIQLLSGNAIGCVNDNGGTLSCASGVVIPTPNPVSGGSQAADTFGEAAINLTNAVFSGTTGCETFGSAYLKSRSSASFTAELKDFIAPIPTTITNCGVVHIIKTTGGSTPLAGATFTLYTSPGGTSAGSCTTNALGTCDIINVTPGTYTLDETTVPVGYVKASGLPTAPFTVSGNQTVTFTFDDPPAPGTVNISKQDDSGNPVSGVVFTVSNGSNTYSCTTDATGSCSISQVQPGTYTVDETPPSGYAKDPQFPLSITVAAGGTVNVSATNPRLFKVIVLVCNEVTNTLYPSAITIDSQSAGSSLSSAGATTAGLSESALCGLTDGARGGLRAAPDNSNPHSASVNIPNTQ